MATRQELIKERRSEPWRNELRKAISNKERTSLEPMQITELHQEPTISSLYIEDKLVFSEETALAEARRCIDCPTPGCVEACPAHIHIPSFIKNLERGDLKAAWRILRERSTLSAICSRVCDHDSQCEGGCIYAVSLKKRAVKIGALERYVATYERTHRAELGTLETPMPRTGHRVAIVGAGPAGLAAAHDLALLGHTVDVYDRLLQPGGVMRMGIPRFRLPADVIDDEVERLEHYGVIFHFGVEIGRDVSLEQLRADGAEVIFLATGATESNHMGVEGETLPGIIPWNVYLYRANMCAPEAAEEQLRAQQARRVAIIGGGNTAMDAARSARRMGANEVTIVYRRGLEEMPACRDEIEHAQSEGINMLTLHTPQRYIPGSDGRVAAMELMEMTLGEPDDSGRRRPVATGQTKIVPVDLVVECVGVSPSPELPAAIPGLETKWGGVMVIDDMQQTSVKGIFAGGDATRGGATVVHAMSDGRKAAWAIHRELSH